MQLIKSITALFYAILMTLGLFNVDADQIEITDVPELAQSDVRIVSFNLRTANDIYGTVKNRSIFVSAALKAYHPDSFGVQEANTKWLELLDESLGEEYARVGESRDNSSNTESSCVFYLKDKYELLDSGTLWLSKTPEVPGSKSFKSSYPRICTFATLKNRETGFTYTHLNTHLDHLLESTRFEQAGVLLDVAKMLEQSGTPVFITGDFNSNENGKAYKRMTESYTDSRLIATESDSGKTYHNYGRGDLINPTAIDFVCVDKGATVSRYKIIRNMVNNMYLSDHYGLCVDITV